MDSVDIIRYKSALKIRIKLPFTYPWGTFSYKVLPFGLCNAPTTFQRVVLNIFSDLIHDIIEIYMDDFTPYGNSFDEALINLDKVLQRCEEMNLSLSHEKCNMLMNEGVVLGHHLSSRGIEVDQNKINIIKHLPTPLKKNMLEASLDMQVIIEGSSNILAS
jgi:hypothetical protein